MIRKGLMYVKKGKPYLVDCRDLDIKNKFRLSKNKVCERPVFNGKIVAEFDFEVEKILNDNHMFDTNYRTKSLSGTELMKFSCLTNYDLVDYLGDDKGYAIHIKNLHIFDEPRELSDYCLYSNEIRGMIRFTLEDSPFILISLSSKEMCRVVNKEQTIIVRKNVLKEML